MTDLYYPLQSLREGHWFKLICGASFQHLPAIRSLVLAYTLAGADCIDVAADPAVILTAKTALKLAADLAATKGDKRFPMRSLPWLMVSLNDGEDPHFRKADFDAATCPPDCKRPCESICPAQAIVFHTAPTGASPLGEILAQGNTFEGSVAVLEPIAGVVSDRCYGCGRCLPVCPIQHISTHSYGSTPAVIVPLVLQAGVDAIEIHTQIGRLDAFRRLWEAIVPWVSDLKLIAISCPDGDGLIDYLRALYNLISPLPCPLVWQLDGRPMSGDIGIGTTRAAVKLGQKVLAANLPGSIQLAGGTNHYTVPKLKALGLLQPSPSLSAMAAVVAREPLETHSSRQRSSYISGVAYGSYARTLLTPILNQLDAIGLEADDSECAAMVGTPLLDSPESHNVLIKHQGRTLPMHLEEAPALLWQAVTLAHSLVSQLKTFNDSQLMRLNL
ncbi:4Fe-4S ferredoxin [Phormidium sp. FACHB-592]|uniref:4Fe-4S ferredoxin n=1 Tax=Stenomitos frigidus AS-A4 TaxID=2933935 RepID=A0ABV0KI47_9CYAN|nr:4Fe-4S ferredoxin [Phormidium sp. FACHB-592]